MPTSADSIIGKSAEPYNDIFGAIPSAFWPGPLRGPMDGHRVRARQAPQEALTADDAGRVKSKRRPLKTSQWPWIQADHTLR